jgi:hypothetical protein
MKFDVQKYLEISTIDGFYYISKRFHIIERFVLKFLNNILKFLNNFEYFFRIFWVIALIFSVTCTSILIGKVVIKVLNFPIVAYLSDQSVPLSEVRVQFQVL